MLSKKYEGSSCEIKTTGNKLLASATLKKVSEKEIELRDPSGQLPILDLNTLIKLVVHNAKLGTQVMAGRVYISSPKIMRLVELQNYATYEKRRFFRLAIDHSAVLICPTWRQKEDGRLTMAWEELAVRVKDISLCGVLFESKKEFSVGDRMRLRMTLEHNELEEMDIIVRRCLPQDDKKTGYGCEFLDLPSRVEQRLSAFVFRQQQEQIRRSRGR